MFRECQLEQLLKNNSLLTVVVSSPLSRIIFWMTLNCNWKSLVNWQTTKYLALCIGYNGQNLQEGFMLLWALHFQNMLLTMVHGPTVPSPSASRRLPLFTTWNSVEQLCGLSYRNCHQFSGSVIRRRFLILSLSCFTVFWQSKWPNANF